MQALYLAVAFPAIAVAFFSSYLPVEIFLVEIYIRGALRVAFVQFILPRWMWSVPAPGLPHLMFSRFTLGISTFLGTIISLFVIPYTILYIMVLSHGETDTPVTTILISCIQFALTPFELIPLLSLLLSLRHVTEPIIVWRRQKLSRLMILVDLQGLCFILLFVYGLVFIIIWWVWLGLVVMPSTLYESTEGDLYSNRV